jgi:hypothetical protein
VCRSAAEAGDGVGTESNKLEERKKHTHTFFGYEWILFLFFLLPGMMKVNMSKLDVKYQNKEIPSVVYSMS